MPVPNFQSLMRPLLEHSADGHDHTHAEAVDALGATLALSNEEREELLPSGKQTRLANRVAWARTHLKHAGLLESPARGVFRITARGLEALAETREAIDMKYLARYPEYLEFRAGKLVVGGNTEAVDDQTPEERLESSHATLRDALADDLLDRMRQVAPAFFEQLVVDLLVAMGYGGSRRDAAQAVGQSGDGGIDGIIKEDKLGLDAVYVQAKRWSGSVGRPVVQAFAGSLEGFRARKGILITTSSFSKDAMDYVGKIEKRIVLIDGVRLADLMIEHGVGVDPVASYVVHKIDEDYFEGQSPALEAHAGVPSDGDGASAPAEESTSKWS